MSDGSEFSYAIGRFSILGFFVLSKEGKILDPSLISGKEKNIGLKMSGKGFWSFVVLVVLIKIVVKINS